MSFYLVLSALQGYYWDTVRGILPILSIGGRKCTKISCQNRFEYIFAGRKLGFGGVFLI